MQKMYSDCNVIDVSDTSKNALSTDYLPKKVSMQAVRFGACLPLGNF